MNGPSWLNGEAIMSKSNDTTKTRELTEAELAPVSGGFTLKECMISGVVAGGGRAPRPVSDGTSNTLLVGE